MPLDRGPSPFTPSHRRFEAMSPLDSEVHPVLHAGRVAVITGAASGIGKAAAEEVVAIAGEANVLVIPTDVSNIDDVVRLRNKVYEAWGEVSELRHCT